LTQSLSYLTFLLVDKVVDYHQCTTDLQERRRDQATSRMNETKPISVGPFSGCHQYNSLGVNSAVDDMAQTAAVMVGAS